VPRILLVSNDRIGSKMAGPGMRYYNLARELASNADVTLVVPTAPDVDLDFADVLVAPDLSYRSFLGVARRSDAVIAQQLSGRAMRALAGGRAKMVYDLYDPLLIEALPLLAGWPDRRRRERTHRAVMLHQLLALSTGDAFLCASDRQRDLWLGLLTALGRVDIDTYARDPTLRGLIEVIPFGLTAEVPKPSRRVMKGVVPGIAETDSVLLWGGGIWDWFDPLTVIRAVARVAETREDVKLFFLGKTHPNPTTGAMTMPARALETARDLGVEGSSVFFNDGWVDYADRANYLLEADVGVSAHMDSAETRFAFRTRILDYFWAGLPTLTTNGDVLGDLVAERKLGRALPAGDVDAWAVAIPELLDDRNERSAVAANLESVRHELAWPRIAGRVAELATGPRVAGTAGLGLREELLTLWRGGARPSRGVGQHISDALRPFLRPQVP
jgi:glycosyltransferase involved in cell wall biosynthesis